MRILVEGRSSIGGIERYTRELLRLLRADLRGDEVLAFGEPAPGAAAHPVRRGFLGRNLGGLKRVFADQYLLPREARRHRAEVLHSTNYFVPRGLRLPCIATFHDLWLLDHFPQKRRGWMRRYERWQHEDALRRADHLVAVSATVAARIMARTGLGPERVSVIHPPLPDLASLASGTEAATRPYFLTVGTLEPRKNLLRLADAQQRAYAECGIPLLIAGRYGWRQRELLARIDASGGALRWLGEVDDATLARLYRDALALVAYSLDEGFDYPTAEALSLGTPVVLSDISVHREVVGDLGLYAPADAPEVLAERLLEAAALGAAQRSAFREAALRRAGELAALGAAERYRALYRRVAGV
jgi:glycosyltransferase involved in cell wall biosynthesis